MKQKTKEEELLAFKRANKERREKLAIKNGYKNAVDYLLYLTGSKVKSNKKSNKKVTIHNVFMLDRSGSMNGGKYENGVLGIQNIIKSIKEDKLTNNTISVIEFDSNFGSMQLVKHAFLSSPEKVDFAGMGARGGTPLYKSLGTIINELLNSTLINKEDKILLNVTTDGGDTEGFGDYPNLPQLIKDIQQNNNFTVTFIGTQQDVNFIISRLNIDKSNTLIHDNTAVGMKMSFATTNSARSMYSSNVSKGKDVLKGFYKQEETL